MKIHILGICGTFMGSLALIARELGYEVEGSDENVYPPMSTQLEEQGIQLRNGYLPENISADVDSVIVGNAMSRGNAAIEYVLNKKLPFTSGPAFLKEALLRDRWVLAVAGTHGKTTTSSMLAWILEYAKLKPGFLIGGIARNFGISARVGDSPFFVIEADEYDTAFFDKASKFLHYLPRTLIINNLEYDHADIFPDLAAIQRQFHILVRTVPSEGQVIMPADDGNITEVMAKGCWSEQQVFALQDEGSRCDSWHARELQPDGSHFAVYDHDRCYGELAWELTGQHNVRNALAAIIAARHAGVTPEVSIEALQKFKSVKRRMELLGTPKGIAVYDDFAHHPTAIATTLGGLRNKVGTQKIIAILEPRSNTMKMGVHKDSLLQSCDQADVCYWLEPANSDWSIEAQIGPHLQAQHQVCKDLEAIIKAVSAKAKAGDHIVIMSNGGFGGLHQKLIAALENQ